MKKNDFNKISKIITKYNVNLLLDNTKLDFLVDNIVIKKNKFILFNWFKEIKETFNIKTNNTAISLLFEWCKETNNIFIEPEEQVKQLTGTWKDYLQYDNKDNIKKNLYNTRLFFENDKYFKGKLKHNELTDFDIFDEDDLEDSHISMFREKLENSIGYNSKDLVETIVTNICKENTFHPYKTEIEKLVWDGTERLEDFFIKFVGVDDIELNRKMTKNWFYGIIKRIYEPGCNFDYMLIIQDQMGGTGKSKIMERFINVFNIGYGYDSTITADNTNKDNVDKLNKAIVVSFEELADFDKKELPQVKSFISATQDVARLAYGHRSKKYNRHCVFYGNSNEEYCLNDYTSPNESERRFWLMEAHGERKDSKWWRENLTDEYIRQMWAEAYYLYVSDKYYEVDLSKNDSDILRDIQNKHKKIGYEDVLSYDINKILDRMYNINKDKRTFESDDDMINNVNKEFNQSIYGKQIEYIPVVWLKSFIEKSLHKSITTNKLTMILRENWEYKKISIKGNKVNCYKRKEDFIENISFFDDNKSLPF